MENINIASKYETDANDDMVLDEEEEEEVWEELLQSAIWEFSFDVHRAIKLKYLFLDPALDPNVDLDNDKDLEQSEGAEKYASGQKAKAKNVTYYVPCPNCKKPSSTADVGKHLVKCLKLGGRTSLRDASRKVTASTDEMDVDHNSSSSTGKKKTKRSQGKRQAQKAKARGNSSKPQSPSENNDEFQNMTHEEKEAFLKEKCGVLSRANKRCVNSCKCIQHTDEERKKIRLVHLSYFDDAGNGQIDADTADKNDSAYLLT